MKQYLRLSGSTLVLAAILALAACGEEKKEEQAAEQPAAPATSTQTASTESAPATDATQPAATQEAAVAPAKLPESADPIKIANFDWTSGVLNTKIMETILKQYGYNVEIVTADYLASLTAGIPTGDLTLGLEYWDTTANEAMAEADKTGKVERLGSLGPKAKEEWWYPAYMKEKCPGLPDWKALNDCAEAFSTPETSPKGRYLGGPVTWGGYDDERVEALGLNYEVVHAGTDANMFAELESAYQRKAPILLWIYSPHWAVAKYEGEWVEFPEYTSECYNDPAWGMNKDMAYDCGKPFGEIWKYAWAGMKDKWPVAHSIAKNYQFEAAEMNALISQVDLDGKSLEEVAGAWVAANQDKIKKWAGQ